MILWVIKMNDIVYKTDAVPKFGPLQPNTTTDVLIVGGGLSGVLCAYMLQQRGVDCMIIEADRILCANTAHTTAKITAQHGLIYSKIQKQYDTDTARLYYRANTKAIAAYKNLGKQFGCDIQSTDNVIYETKHFDRLHEELKVLQKIGADTVFDDCRALPFFTLGGVRMKNQAKFDVLELAGKIARKLNIYEHTRLVGLRGNTVITDNGNVTAEKIVFATHFPVINRYGMYYAKMHQSRSYVAALKGAPVFDTCYMGSDEGQISLRQLDNLLLIGGGGGRCGEENDGLKTVADFAAQHFSDAQIVAQYAAQDCMTPDSIPYAGYYSRFRDDLYVMTGYNKWGMTSAMAAAGTVADMITTGTSEYQALFDPHRAMPLKDLVQNACYTAKNMMRITKPRCPHLGCALVYNKKEHSWDCPCHGSRFDKSGNILDGPAKKGMKKAP